MYIFCIYNSTELRLLIGHYSSCLPLTSLSACLLILMFSDSFIAISGKKKLVYASYSQKIYDVAFYYYNAANKRAHKESIDIVDSGTSRTVM